RLVALVYFSNPVVMLSCFIIPVLGSDHAVAGSDRGLLQKFLNLSTPAGEALGGTGKNFQPRKSKNSDALSTGYTTQPMRDRR
ncbi:MAG: hypothetical protein AB1744_03375, partial [Candidatus Zixiibacteriota bacterium]